MHQGPKAAHSPHTNPAGAVLAQIHESSPLDLASEEPERLPCLQRLLDLGADVNAADKHGRCLKGKWDSLGPGHLVRETR